MIKKSVYILILVIFSFSVFGADSLNSDNFNKIQADSVFVVDVDWKKIDNTQYDALITIDLNYVGLMNPVGRFSLVEAYQWRNWFRNDVTFSDLGEDYWYIDEDGNTVETFLLKYYFELHDISDRECGDEWGSNWRCDLTREESRIGYHGLPFYIQEVEFVCDVSDKSKGGLLVTPNPEQSNVINLIRPNYIGLDSPKTVFEMSDIPLGWGTAPGEIIRYSGLPVKCFNMDTTENSKLYFKLRPNPYYRHYNPDIEGSETWEYGDIISSLASVTNSESLPFTMNIDFNFSGQFWDYTVTQEESDAILLHMFGTPEDYEWECDLVVNNKIIETVKYSELTEFQKAVINQNTRVCTIGGELISFSCEGELAYVECHYPETPVVTNINEVLTSDYENALSQQKQTIILNQINMIDKKLANRKFFSKTVIPFFAFIMLIIFYMFELIIISIIFLGLIPMMFNQFIKGLKDAFDIDDLLKKNHGVKRGKK